MQKLGEESIVKMAAETIFIVFKLFPDDHILPRLTNNNLVHVINQLLDFCFCGVLSNELELIFFFLCDFFMF